MSLDHPLLNLMFSLVEGVGLMSLMLTVFRINFHKHFNQMMLLNLLCSLITEFMLKGNVKASIIIVILLPLIFLYLAIVIEIPLIWSLIVTVGGYIVFAFLQTGIIMTSFGFFDDLKDHYWKAYLLSTITGISGYFISYFLYRRGYGFSFEFEKIRFAYEKIIVIILSILTITGFSVFLYYRSIVIAIVVISISLVVFLSYAVKKQKDEKFGQSL